MQAGGIMIVFSTERSQVLDRSHKASTTGCTSELVLGMLSRTN